MGGILPVSSGSGVLLGSQSAAPPGITVSSPGGTVGPPPITSDGVHPAVWHAVKLAAPPRMVPIPQLQDAPLVMPDTRLPQDPGVVPRGGFVPLSAMKFGLGGFS